MVVADVAQHIYNNNKCYTLIFRYYINKMFQVLSITLTQKKKKNFCNLPYSCRIDSLCNTVGPNIILFHTIFCM